MTEWWTEAVFYEVYVRSFRDSNGDGIGDLNGITERLDYLVELGIDAVWLTPFYPSPQVDFGYDISNYQDVDPQFGTLGDFDRLVAEAHRRGLKIVTDLVLNHTSDQHPWFLDSRSARDARHRDWYIWRDPRPDGGPPTNWSSAFGPSTWTFDPRTGQYYYHFFYPEQPDLNWRNPQVQAAMFDMIGFWIERGVDGFRLDAIQTLFEDEALRDNPLLPGLRPGSDSEPAQQWRYTTHQPET
ncbi:MAG: alpha-amylase family glycosyl hydrolase, partial [Chloroflexota bacterium]|nr:alpha-amylase family glycosyl hydrolase [Chloroflexota bacterium]